MSNINTLIGPIVMSLGACVIITNFEAICQHPDPRLIIGALLLMVGGAGIDYWTYRSSQDG